MNSFLKGIKEATADAGPDIAAVVERLETAGAEADKEAASRAADIRSTAARVASSCSIDGKGHATFINFDPYADFAATGCPIAKRESAVRSSARNEESRKTTSYPRLMDYAIFSYSRSRSKTNESKRKEDGEEASTQSGQRRTAAKIIGCNEPAELSYLELR
jgi:hypothetical protein